MNPDTLHARLKALHARLNLAGPGPLYLRVAQRLGEAIRLGSFTEGEMLPPQAELAGLLGVSQMTVRRAMAELVGRGLIESTRGRGTMVRGVQGVGAARQASATPDGASLRQGNPAHQRLRLGVVFASVADGYPFLVPVLGPLEAGVPGELEVDRPILQTFYVDPCDDDPASLQRQVPLTDLDGLLLMSPLNTALLTAARQQGLPCVLLFNDLSAVGSHCVTCDYMPGIHAAVAHLKATGCARPALVTAGVVRHSTGPVLDAMTFACATLGLPLPPDRIIHADYTQPESFTATSALLRRRERPDCIVYCSETQAEGGLLAADRLGVAVPEALSIIALGSAGDDSPWSRRLTVVDIGLGAMGRLALDVIRRQHRAPGNPGSPGAPGLPGVPRRQTVRSSLILGQTTRAIG